MLIFRFITLFCVTARTGVHAENISVFSYSPVLQLCILPLSETLPSL